MTHRDELKHIKYQIELEEELAWRAHIAQDYKLWEKHHNEANRLEVELRKLSVSAPNRRAGK